MTSFELPCCPEPPDWKLDWKSILDLHRSLPLLGGVSQDPVYHGEGNVLIHTRRVCEALVDLEEWRNLPRAVRHVVFTASLLHDLGKLYSTRIDESGKITSRGHGRTGAWESRLLLEELARSHELELPFTIKETIVALVRNHSLPTSFLSRKNPEKEIHAVSQVVECDLLALLSKADVLGRVCEDQGRSLDSVELFRSTAIEEQCLNRPKSFPSDHTRFLYFRTEGRSPDVEAFDDTRSKVTIMSGIPASGKSTWIKENLGDQDVISLDALRDEMKIKPSENQGRVIQRAREMAREHLREGRSFCWDSTSISRDLRDQLIGLMSSYRARVKIAYMDMTLAEALERNRGRSRRVSDGVIEKLIRKIDLPDLTEAHEVTYEEATGRAKFPWTAEEEAEEDHAGRAQADL